MVAKASDISLVLSGGSVNVDPNLSIGGNPSSTPVNSNALNNIFNDVTPDQSLNGLEDYRCIYFFNDSADPIFNLKLSILSETENGSSVTLGIQDNDEIQRLTITGTPTGGSFSLTYLGKTYVSNYNADLSLWANALQNGLNALEDTNGNPLLTGAVVNAQNTTSGIIFDIHFTNYDGKRIQDLLTISSTLTGSVTLDIIALQNGAPINTIAPTIDVSTTPPGNGIFFYSPTDIEPILIPRLESTEGFPLWVKRTTVANAIAVANDGFVLRVQMTALK